MDNPYLLLNRGAFEAAGISEEEAENTTKSMVEQIFAGFVSRTGDAPAGRQKEPPALTNIYTTKQMREGSLPQTQYGRLIAHSYSPYVGWALHVPLELFGTAFVPGTYHGVVAPVDIAATFASLLRINRPSAAVGRVLTEAIRPEGVGTTSVSDTQSVGVPVMRGAN
jgi:hypothetical protein